jgi:hypothetical protein
MHGGVALRKSLVRAWAHRSRAFRWMEGNLVLHRIADVGPGGGHWGSSCVSPAAAVLVALAPGRSPRSERQPRRDGGRGGGVVPIDGTPRGSGSQLAQGFRAKQRRFVSPIAGAVGVTYKGLPTWSSGPASAPDRGTGPGMAEAPRPWWSRGPRLLRVDPTRPALTPSRNAYRANAVTSGGSPGCFPLLSQLQYATDRRGSPPGWRLPDR